MLTLPRENDSRVMNVQVDEQHLTIKLMDGRSLSVPIIWYPRLAAGSSEQRKNWQPAAAGYGIHWPELDEDLSTEGLLQEVKGILPQSLS